MPTRFLSRMAFLPLAFMATWMMCAGAVVAGPSPEAARLDVFSAPDGATYFALSLKPGVDVAAPEGSDVIVMFDTSSSQTGAFRENALAALENLLANLGPKDRVRLFAVDLNAVAMNPSFAAPKSPEMAEALAKLKARVPLGATNMEAAMTTAATSFSSENRPRACVYLGDGMSAANVLGTEEFAKLVGTLVNARVAVSCYGVGPRLDGQMLGALAGRTGGVVTSQEHVAVVKEGQGQSLAPAEVGQ
ncbi:MAG TPA: VWA domain-containing protein, partial [Thermoguttaceae bacterium]|nr:VWA domain-containing protein [Thermoguttaceae bacterium]